MINSFILNNALRNRERVKIADPDNAAVEIAMALINLGILFFENGIPIIMLEFYYTSVSSDDVEALLYMLLDDESRLIVRHSQITETINRIKYNPKLQIDLSADFKKAENYVNVHNGVYDIFRQEIVYVRNQYKFDYVLNFNYSPNHKLSDAPYFEKFVKSSIGEEQLECLLRVIGYGLSSQTKGRKAFVFYGIGKTGKSTLLNVIESVIPPELVSHEPFFTMSSERSKAHYHGKRVNISRETSVKINRNEESFKSLISNEYTTGSEKYEKAKDFIPTLSFYFAGNADLEFSALDDELLDRLVYIMFTRKIKDEDIDLDLEEKLMSERDVIFSLALDSLKGLIADKYDFRMSKEAEDHIRNRRITVHSTELFLDEMTEVKAGSSISSVILFAAYNDFCHRNGMTPIGRNKFYEKVRNYASEIKQDRVPDTSKGSSVRGFRNLKLNWKPEQDNGKEE